MSQHAVHDSPPEAPTGLACALWPSRSYARKCLGVLTVFRCFWSPSFCRFVTKAKATSPARNGHSPLTSWLRPLFAREFAGALGRMQPDAGNNRASYHLGSRTMLMSGAQKASAWAVWLALMFAYARPSVPITVATSSERSSHSDPRRDIDRAELARNEPEPSSRRNKALHWSLLSLLQ